MTYSLELGVANQHNVMLKTGERYIRDNNDVQYG